MMCRRMKFSLVTLVILFIGMRIAYKAATLQFLPVTRKGNTRELGEIGLDSAQVSEDRLKKSIEATVPLIYIITPTHGRLEQKADLTRLSQTLRLVNHLHWIVIEDSTQKTTLVTDFLQQCCVPYTHLHVKSMNVSEWKKVYQGRLRMSKGVIQRNLAIDWIEKNANESYVIYFADDDNAYNVRIFEEMRYTRGVSVWPVGLVGGSKYESPVVRNGQVKGWIAGYFPNREFAIDMAGFAVNGQLIKATKARFNVSCISQLESCFLAKLNIGIGDLEPKADNCTKVLVWHTRTSNSILVNDPTRRKLVDKFSEKDLEV